jgi:hypothetical protein
VIDDLPVAVWECAVCGSANETAIDPELGSPQKFTDDCRICCHPNLLRIRVDAEGDLLVDVVFDE